MYIRRQVEAELRRRMAGGEPLHETVEWLGGTGEPVGDAVEMLVGPGLTQEQAEEALMANESWANLIRVTGGFGASPVALKSGRAAACTWGQVWRQVGLMSGDG